MPVTITRSILVVFLPGIVATIPFVLLFIIKYPALSDLYKEYFYLFNIVLAGNAVIVGSIIEGGVSHIENKWDDLLDDEYSVKNNWYKYLSLSIDKEPVGFRYISRLATTMYFELGMMCSAPIFCLGAVINLYINTGTEYAAHNVFLIIASLITASFFYWQAKTTHKVLCVTRKEINTRLANS